MIGDDLAGAALALVGTPFRLHGRDSATGIDCIGLFAAAMARAGRPVTVPNGYRLRARSLPDLAAIARASGFSAVPVSSLIPGDVCMVRPGPVQFHLVIAAPAGRIVHAHAGLGKVVTVPAPLDWPIISQWRLVPVS